MNWADLIIIVGLLFFAYEGIGRSFILETLDFLSFLAAFILSLRFYNLSAKLFEQNFQLPHSLALVLGFIGVWFLAEFLLFVTSHLILSTIPINERVHRILDNFSFIPAFLRGLIFIAVLLILLGIFPIQPMVKLTVQNSKIAQIVLSKVSSLETPLKSVFGGLSQDTLTFLTIKPKSNETVNLGFKTSNFKPNPALEEQMIDLVNKERAQRGLKTLKFDQKLQLVARDHSADMFDRGYFSHYSPEGKTVADRAEKYNVNYLVIGENLAYAPSLELAHNGLMNSEGHRANILSVDYRKIGIGIMDGGAYGLMITQVFSD